MNAKWLFFDIGSTLVDESLCYEQRCFDIVKNTNISAAEFKNKVIEFAKQNKDAFHAAAKYYNLDIPRWAKELEVLYSDAQNVLSVLSQKYKIGIIANQSSGSAERLNAWNIGCYIDLVVASAEEGVSKPDLKIFETALNRAECSPDDAVMIGDRLDNDIIPAKKLGFKSIWIKQGFAAYQSAKNTEEIPDLEIGCLSDLLLYL